MADVHPTTRTPPDRSEPFGQLADLFPVGLFLTDPDGRRLRVNAGWRAYAGVTPDWNPAEGWCEVVHPDDRARIQAAWATAVREQHDFHAELRFARPEGEPLWVLAAARFTPGVGFGGTVTDISSQKQQEQNFLQAQRLAGLGSWEWDIPTNRVCWSDEVFRIFRVDPQTFGGTLEAFLGFIHPEDRPRVEATWRGRVSRPEAVAHAYRVICGDGTERMLESRGTVVTDAAGKAVKAFGTVLDVTENRRLDAALQEERHKLRERYEALQALDRLKSNFVNAISHDLRTPLTSIKGYAEFLEDEIGGPVSDEQHGFVSQILQSSTRLEHLVDDLLDFARLDAGTFKLERRASDFGRLAREVVDSLRPQFQEARLRVTLRLPDAPLTLPLDSPRIERVLINLLTNAIKFTPPDGAVEIHVSRQEDTLRCEVADTGIGIEPEDLPKLFQRFSQLALSSHKGGTGLGLSISRALIEAHGGQIGVESTLGRGSTFWFTLPMSAHAAEQVASPEP